MTLWRADPLGEISTQQPNLSIAEIESSPPADEGMQRMLPAEPAAHAVGNEMYGNAVDYLPSGSLKALKCKPS